MERGRKIPERDLLAIVKNGPKDTLFDLGHGKYREPGFVALDSLRIGMRLTGKSENRESYAVAFEQAYIEAGKDGFIGAMEEIKAFHKAKLNFITPKTPARTTR